MFTGCGQLLGDPATETACALDGEPALGPGLGPLGQLSEGSGVDDEPVLPDRVTGGVDGGEGGFARVDPDGDHRWAPRWPGGDGRGEYPDLKPLSSHTTAGAGRQGTLSASQPEGGARSLRTCADRHPGR
jgi:hypothetical protein